VVLESLLRSNQGEKKIKEEREKKEKDKAKSSKQGKKRESKNREEKEHKGNEESLEDSEETMEPKEIKENKDSRESREEKTRSFGNSWQARTIQATIQQENNKRQEISEVNIPKTMEPPKLESPRLVEQQSTALAWTTPPSAPRVSLTQIQMEETLKSRTGKKEKKSQDHQSGNSLEKEKRKEKRKKEEKEKRAHRTLSDTNAQIKSIPAEDKVLKPFKQQQQMKDTEQLEVGVPSIKVAWEAKPVSSIKEQVISEKNEEKSGTLKQITRTKW